MENLFDFLENKSKEEKQKNGAVAQQPRYVYQICLFSQPAMSANTSALFVSTSSSWRAPG